MKSIDCLFEEEHLRGIEGIVEENDVSTREERWADRRGQASPRLSEIAAEEVCSAAAMKPASTNENTALKYNHSSRV